MKTLRKAASALKWAAVRVASCPPLAAALALAVVAMLVSASAWARVGGGESFSSGSHSSSSGGGSSDDSDLIFFLLWLCIEHPAIGIPVTLVVIVIGIVKYSAKSSTQSWTAGANPNAVPTQWAPPVSRAARRDLERVREQDPEFSTILFEDFLYALYAAAQEARGQGKLETLSPYLSPGARARFHPLIPGLPRPSEVKDVIVGAMKVTRASGLEPTATAVRVSVRFETNFTEVVQGREMPVYAVEMWHLSRKKGVASRPPARARKIGCPSCGAALDAIRGNTCSYCKQVVDTGAFDWRVENLDVLNKEPRPPVAAGGGSGQGPHLPTLIAPDVQQNVVALVQRDPEFGMELFRARAGMIFRELQAAWSERDWMRVRPFVSDSLFQMQLYWIEGFKRQKVRNVIDRLELGQMETAAISCDAHYDAITLRIFASCLDYTLTEDGRVLRGSRSVPTKFSEYWTFIRGSGVKGKPSAEKKCPNCGAPQKINQAGSCEFCQAKITSGEFDWVLSRIEQDEVYAG